MIVANSAVPYNYTAMNPYRLSPLQPLQKGPAGGRTLLTTVIVIASVILIGMALGLGLGIAAVGAITDGMLIAVTNLTQTVNVSNSTATTAANAITTTTIRVG